MAPFFAWFLQLLPDAADADAIRAGVEAGSITASLLFEPGWLKGATAREGSGGKSQKEPKAAYKSATWGSQDVSFDLKTFTVTRSWPCIGWDIADLGAATKVFAMMYVHEPSASAAKRRHRLYVFDGAISKTDASSQVKAAMIPLDLVPPGDGHPNRRETLAVQKSKLKMAFPRLWGHAQLRGLDRGHKTTTPRVLLSRLVMALTGSDVYSDQDSKPLDVDHWDRDPWHNCDANLSVFAKEVHELISRIDAGDATAISELEICLRAARGDIEGAPKALQTPSLLDDVAGDPRFAARLVMAFQRKARQAGRPG